jgi:hypothetical protein
VDRQDPLEDENLVGAFGALAPRDEHLGHTACPEAPVDLKASELRRRGWCRSGHEPVSLEFILCVEPPSAAPMVLQVSGEASRRVFQS